MHHKVDGQQCFHSVNSAKAESDSIRPDKTKNITVRAPHKLVCTKNTALGGVSRQKEHSASPRAVFVSQHANPRAVFSVHTCSSALTNTYTRTYISII